MRPHCQLLAPALAGMITLTGCATVATPDSVAAAPERTCDVDFFTRSEGARFLAQEMTLLRKNQPLGIIAVAEALAIAPDNCDAAFETARNRADVQNAAGLGFAAQQTLLAAFSAGLVPDTERASVQADMHEFAVSGTIAAQSNEEGAQVAPRRLTAALTPTPQAPIIPHYPALAHDEQIEGSCIVRFDLSETGEPSDVSARCSDDVFKVSAESVIREARFEPFMSYGPVDDSATGMAQRHFERVPTARTGMEFPVIFSLPTTGGQTGEGLTQGKQGQH